MSRTKNDGKGRLGGRAKGTPNKATTDLRMWIKGMLEDGQERFKNSLNQLEPTEFIRVYTQLLNFVLPKQAPTTPEEQLRKEKEMLQDLLFSLPSEMVERVAKKIKELTQIEEEENDNEFDQ